MNFLADTLYGIAVGYSTTVDHNKIKEISKTYDLNTTIVSCFIRTIQAIQVSSLFRYLGPRATFINNLPFTSAQAKALTIGLALLVAAVENRHIKIPRSWNKHVVKILHFSVTCVNDILRVAAAVGAVAQIAFGSPVLGTVILGFIAYDYADSKKLIPERISKSIATNLAPVWWIARIGLAILM
jgi:hypothetical protein